MQRILKITLTLILSIYAVTARADTEMTDRYWEMFLAGNIDEIEAELDDLDGAVKAGQRSYGDQRKVYGLFSTTHPDIENLLSDWRKKHPDSRHAMAGEMWRSLYVAWLYRGVSSTRYTHPSAMSEFRHRLSESQYLADELYKKHIDFIPGTDGKMVLLRTDFRGAEKALDKVLRATPNIGSLTRALTAFAPRWHGSATELRRICRKYAAVVSKYENYPADACIANAYAKADLDGFLEKAYIRTGIDKYTDLIDYQVLLKDALYTRPDEAKARAAFAKRTEAEPRFASELSKMVGDRSIWQEEREREKREDALNFERDPNNPNTISDQVHVLQSDVQKQMQELFTNTIINAQEDGLITNDNPTAEQLRYGRELNQKVSDDARKLHEKVLAEIDQHLQRGADIGRFDPFYWFIRSRNGSRSSKLGYFEDKMFKLRMSVLYSNYMPRYLKSYYGHALDTFRNVSKIVERDDYDVLPAYDKPKEILEHLACESVRAARLLEQHCKSLKYGVTCLNDDDFPQPKAFLKDARHRKLCPKFRLGAIEYLYIEEPDER